LQLTVDAQFMILDTIINRILWNGSGIQLKDEKNALLLLI